MSISDVNMPNFLIIGAQKSGTTALYHALCQHPQIFMSPEKEPGFFALDGRLPSFGGPLKPKSRFQNPLDWPAYLALFAESAEQPARGEASTYYTYCWPEQTAANIYGCLPHARLIAILRQPAERAYSAFNMMRQKGLEPLADFHRALAVENAIERMRWTPDFRYFQNGLYSASLKPYFDRFPRSQIHIYLYEDWNTRPDEVVRGICHFLEVDELFTPAMSERRNVTLVRRSDALQTFLKQPHLLKSLLHSLVPQKIRKKLISHLRAWNQIKPPPLDPAMRHELTESYREDILCLQDLIGRDLSHWLK